MKIDAQPLLAALQQIVQQSQATAQSFQQLDNSILQIKPSPNAWNIIQCIEHLNFYARFYLPEFTKCIANGNAAKEYNYLTPGFIGNYFVSLIQVKNGTFKKLTAPANKRPQPNCQNVHSVLQTFNDDCRTLQNLLQQATHVHLTKTKSAISLSPFIKLRLGDALRFYVYHIERHVLQASRIVSQNHIASNS